MYLFIYLIHIYRYICVYLFIWYIYIYLFIWYIYIYVYLFIWYIYIFIYLYDIYIYICIYLFIYLFIYLLYIYMYIYMYTALWHCLRSLKAPACSVSLWTSSIMLTPLYPKASGQHRAMFLSTVDKSTWLWRKFDGDYSGHELHTHLNLLSAAHMWTFSQRKSGVDGKSLATVVQKAGTSPVHIVKPCLMSFTVYSRATSLFSIVCYLVVAWVFPLFDHFAQVLLWSTLNHGTCRLVEQTGFQRSTVEGLRFEGLKIQLNQILFL